MNQKDEAEALQERAKEAAEQSKVLVARASEDIPQSGLKKIILETIRDLTRRGITELATRMPAHAEWIRNNPRLVLAGYLLRAANLIADRYNPSLTIPAEGSEWNVVKSLILGVVPALFLRCS